MTEPKPHTPIQVIKKKPKWLKILEKQSWQAELVISGLAIYGSLQLPVLVNQAMDYALFTFPEKYMMLVMYFFIYLLFAVHLMIVSFIVHFVLRTLWIGMLGLVSVYPHGINPDYEHFSQDYMQKLLQEFPDINDFNKRLDNLCSTMFASTASGVMMMVMISVMVATLMLLTFLINTIIPSSSTNVVFILFMGVFLLFSFASGIFATKKFREKEWVKKIHFPLYKNFSKATSLISYEPSNYIMLTFLTNSKRSKFYIVMMLTMFTTMVPTFFTLTNSNLGYFYSRNYFSHGSYDNRIYPKKYENLLPPNTVIFVPIIQSDIINGSSFRLFIPWLNREQPFADDLCGEYNEDQENDDLSRKEKRMLRGNFRLDCISKYYRIELNGQTIENLEFFNYDHPNQNESGFVTYIPTENCKPGKNELNIISHYTYEEEGMKEIPINFIFEKE